MKSWTRGSSLLLISIFVHCQTLSPVARSVPAPVPPVVSWASVRPPRVGPFYGGMPAQDAAALCGGTPATTTNITTRDEFGTSIEVPALLCEVKLDEVLHRVWVSVPHRRVSELFIQAPLSNRVTWPDEIDHLLSLMQKLHRASPLRVVNEPNGPREAVSLPMLTGKALETYRWAHIQPPHNLPNLVVKYADDPDVSLWAEGSPRLRIGLLRTHKRVVPEQATAEEQPKRDEPMALQPEPLAPKPEAGPVALAFAPESKAVPAAPVAVLPISLNLAKDIRPDRVGPFVYGMPMAEAARLCGQPLSPTDQNDIEHGVNQIGPHRLLSHCKMATKTHSLVVTLEFKNGRLTSMDLVTEEGAFQNDTGYNAQEEWLKIAANMLPVFHAFQPARALRVQNIPVLEAGKRTALWRGKGPLPARKLLALFRKGDLFQGIAVTGDGIPSPALYATLRYFLIQVKLSPPPST